MRFTKEPDAKLDETWSLNPQGHEIQCRNKAATSLLFERTQAAFRGFLRELTRCKIKAVANLACEIN